MKQSLRHWTPRYFYNKSKLLIRQALHPGEPWLTAGANEILSEILMPTDVAVEFGSGRSTAWFAERVKHLTSIESDPVWFEKVGRIISELGLDEKIDYRLVHEMDKYHLQSDTFPDESVDFCLVDGMERSACALSMIPKMKPAGILVVDNVNWFLPNDKTHSPSSRTLESGPATEEWGIFQEVVSDWKRIWTSNGVTDTCFFFKPS
jgi:hypothetical protein